MSILLSDESCKGYDFHSVYALLAVSAVRLQPLVRPRLIIPLLDNIERHKVTLIRGPAGSGKSVLIEQLIRALPPGTQSALLSLNTGRLAGGSIRASLLSLFARFSSMGKSRSRFVIFIDDADEVLKRETEALEQCLNSLPPQGRLVIASRRPLQTFHPGISAGHDQALRLGDMLFTLDELRAALTQAEKPLNAAALMTLWRFTEGWPAVVALLCASDPGDSVLDVQRLLQEWFEEELLSALEPGLLAFVLDASTVDPMQPELIDSMRGQPGSAQMLRKLGCEHDLLVRSSTGFPRPLLFVLRSMHRRIAAHRVRELHRAALETLLDSQALEPALEHAFHMGDRRLLLGLLAQHDNALLCAGRMRSLARWLEALDSEGHLAEAPRLQLTLAWAKLFISDQDVARRIVQHLRQRPMAAEQERTVQALELTWLSTRDHVEVLSARAELWLEEDSANPFAQGMNNCTVALAHLVCGKFAQAEQSLAQGVVKHAGIFVDAYAASIRSMLCLFRGQPEAAREQLQQMLNHDCGSGKARRGNSLMAMLEALALYEMGCCDEVLALLELHMPLLRQTGLLDQIILAYKLHARILMARGDSGQAQVTLASLECLGRAGKMARLVFCARLEEVRCALIRGDVDLAREQLQALHSNEGAAFIRDFSFLPSDNDTWELMDARVRLAEDKIEYLPEQLSQALEQALAAGRERRALTLRILLAMALEQRNNEHAALKVMEAALDFAEPRGLIQAFRDEGKAALALALRASQAAAQRRDFAQRLVAGSGLKMPDCPGEAAANLTSKELQVLALLAGGQSNIALAEKLFVSESTVRTHLRSINAKLNARSRLEALAIARRDGLIAV
ncbi:LuxR C-terminal-related transcriptional regulator [Pseudomonas sp. NFACC13-1]|uniref:LuxR C-terminal-related transcriptional regulator n=1 Tax=Pseudomonas sp. NFACC13-1 TaxID=1566245 RepID=UPI00089191F5|nr:LuxR C-terminal-related transcriptional regulator [Pseudomonas sp. NFACC13-1]SDB35135.1 LuxR family transcriptional regulator, maltose regulon positive regulatory protein [Pseudomonas sp. NFACC13-1]